MNGVVIIPAQSGSVAKQLCNAQFEGITPVKDTLLTLIVMVGALAAYWVVLFQQYRKRPRPGSRYYGSAGGGGDAGGEGGGHKTGLVVTAIPEITAAAAIPAEATPAAAMEAGVTAAGVAAIEAPLAPVV